MTRMTIEQAEKILRDSDAGVPEKFEVVRVAYSKSADAYFVEWTNGATKDAYKAAVANSADPKAAENAYSVGRWKQFSAIFVNDAADGAGKSFAAETRGEDDLGRFMELEDLVVTDAR